MTIFLEDKIRSEYEEIIKNADLLFNDKSYNDALQKYDEANEILPNEPYPIDKIREIKKLLIKKNQRIINIKDILIKQIMSLNLLNGRKL